ncbi:MAG: Do family serine endopeptidase [Desulfobacterales bacterium]|nr:Do family serine endopeptidase [Desulfobacterales bacterium]
MKKTRQTIKTWTILLAAGLMLALHPLGAGAATNPGDGAVLLPVNFPEIARKAKPSVVNIRTVRTIKEPGRRFHRFFGEKHPFDEFFKPYFEDDHSREFKQPSLGSGIIIDREGYIVTNNHVIARADKIQVKLANEKEYAAVVVGRDPNTDLALIKITTTDELTPLPMGDSDALQVGAWVVAIGSPFGLEQTVTAGIVSGKERIIGSGPYDNFIQTDALINPGNSGGPLLNLKGEVVGINTAIIPRGNGNIGFAIPINMTKDIVAQLKGSGEVKRGWLGVGIQNLTPELAEYYGVEGGKGVLITKVFEGDPAGKAGIKPEDVIVAVGEKKVSSARELSMTIARSDVGERVPITLIREGEKITVHATLGKRMDERAEASPKKEDSDALGLRLESVTPETARKLGLSEDDKGLVVLEVKPNSKAYDADIRPGDLIREINRRPVETPGDFKKQLGEIDEGEKFRVLINRQGAGFIVVQLVK